METAQAVAPLLSVAFIAARTPLQVSAVQSATVSLRPGDLAFK